LLYLSKEKEKLSSEVQVRPQRYRILHEVTDLSTRYRYRFIHGDMNPSTRCKIVHKDTD